MAADNMTNKHIEQLLEHIYDSNNGFDEKNHDNAHQIIVIFEHSGKRIREEHDNTIHELYQIDKSEQVERIMDNLSVLFQIEEHFPHYADKAWQQARSLVEQQVNDNAHELAYTLNQPENDTYIHMHRVIIDMDEFFKPVFNEPDYHKLQQLMPSVFAHIQAEQNPLHMSMNNLSHFSSTLNAEEQYARLLNRASMLEQQLKEVQQQIKSFEHSNVSARQHRLEEMNRSEPMQSVEHYEHELHTEPQKFSGKKMKK